MGKVMRMNWGAGGFEEVKEPKLERGQIIHSWSGMGGYLHGIHVLVKVEHNKWGTNFHTINTKDYSREVKSHIRPLSEKNSLGSYYTDGETVSEEEVVKYEKQAEEKQGKDQEERKRKEEVADQFIEKGKTLFDQAIAKHGHPKALIIAKKKEDQSDITTDLFCHSTSKKVILAFSKHTRNNFREFRKAALKSDIPGIRALATAPVSFEHRENYSMGGGYYLGASRHSGWEIRKEILYRKYSIKDFYLAAGQEDGFTVG